MGMDEAVPFLSEMIIELLADRQSVYYLEQYTMVLWYTLVTLRTGKGTGMFTENTVWKAVERLINANADNDSDGLSPYESGYINGYNDALVDLLNALNIEHDFHHFD